MLCVAVPTTNEDYITCFEVVIGFPEARRKQLRPDPEIIDFDFP